MIPFSLMFYILIIKRERKYWSYYLSEMEKYIQFAKYPCSVKDCPEHCQEDRWETAKLYIPGKGIYVTVEYLLKDEYYYLRTTEVTVKNYEYEQIFGFGVGQDQHAGKTIRLEKSSLKVTIA